MRLSGDDSRISSPSCLLKLSSSESESNDDVGGVVVRCCGDHNRKLSGDLGRLYFNFAWSRSDACSQGILELKNSGVGAVRGRREWKLECCGCSIVLCVWGGGGGWLFCGSAWPVVLSE